MIRNVFPTLIYLEQLDGSEQTEDLHNAVLDLKQQLTMPWPEGVVTSFSFKDGDKCFLADYKLDYFRDIILKHVRYYVTEVSGQQSFDITISNSFLNVIKKEGFQFSHRHPYSTVSGVYYYSANESDATMNFENPNIVSDFVDPAGMLLPNQATFVPSTSRLILFPSWLSHRVNLHKADSERIAMSFNFGIKWN
jgi:uncharacterized protein (TIGR02466 family)